MLRVGSRVSLEGIENNEFNSLIGEVISVSDTVFYHLCVFVR